MLFWNNITFFLSIVSPWKKLGKAEVENPRLLNLFQPLVTVIVYNSAADCRQTGRSLSTYHVHNIRFCSNTVGFHCVQQDSRQTGRLHSTGTYRVKMLLTVIVYNSAADCRQTGRSLSTYHVHNIRFCSNTVGFHCVQQDSRQTGRSNSTDRVKMLLTGILY